MERPEGSWDKVCVELGGEEEACLSKWLSCALFSTPGSGG